MYAQARASLKPAPRTQSNQDAPVHPSASNQNGNSNGNNYSPSLESPVNLVPTSRNASSRPTSIVNGHKRDSTSPNLLPPLSPALDPSSSSQSSSNHQASNLNSSNPIRWIVHGINSNSIDFVKAFPSPTSSTNHHHHSVAAVIDSDSKAASQFIDSLSTFSSKVTNDNDKIQGFESLESLLSSSFPSPPTHIYISTSTSRATPPSPPPPSSSSTTSTPTLTNQKTTPFQIASLALKSGLGVLIDKSVILDPDLQGGIGRLSHSEARQLVSLARGKQTDEENGQEKITNGRSSEISKFLGLMYNELEKEELPTLLSSIYTAYNSDQAESNFPGLSWQISLGVIKTLDSLRSQIQAKPHRSSSQLKTPRSPRKAPSSPSRIPRSPSRKSPQPRIPDEPFPTSGSPKVSSGLGLLMEEVNGTSLRGEPVVAEGDVVTQAALQAQIQELQQLLRHKNALITSLEQRATTASVSSIASTSSRRSSITAAQGHSSSPVLPRRRTTSLEPSKSSSRTKSPGPDSPRTPGGPSNKSTVSKKASASASSSSRPSSPSAGSSSGRRKSTELARPLSPLSPPVSSVNQLDAVSEGFLAPTIASENRRMANLGININGSASSGGLNTTSLSSSNPNSSGKVINNLTQSLSAMKEALDATKAQLRTSQKNANALQKSQDDLKEALSRARLENESSVGMITRKDRQTAEAVERARKAEAESKELGRASREWGTRVRQVEEELGELRRKNARAEREYETVASCWKVERRKMQDEVEKIKQEVIKVRGEEMEEVKKLKNGLLEAQRKWRGLDVEKEKEGLGNLLDQLESNREKAVLVLGKEIEPLLKRMDENDEITREQEKVVREVEGELRRIKTLMRRAENAGV